MVCIKSEATDSMEEEDGVDESCADPDDVGEDILGIEMCPEFGFRVF